VQGPVQREGSVIHVIAERVVDLTGRLRALAAPVDAPAPPRADPGHAAEDRRQFPSRDFH
jgi:hypothetical protein